MGSCVSGPEDRTRAISNQENNASDSGQTVDNRLAGRRIESKDETIQDLRGQLKDLKKQLRDQKAPSNGQDSRIFDLEKEIRHFKTEQSKLKVEKDRLQNEHEKKISDLSDRLAREMQSKIATNETDLENVSIRNRPMNVRDEYLLLMSEQWLAAKVELDERSPVSEDWDKLFFLNRVIQVCERVQQQVFEMFQRQLALILWSPDSVMASSTVDPEDVIIVQDDEKPVLPNELSNAAGDFLRKEADTVNLDKVEREVFATLEKECDNDRQLKLMWDACHQSNALRSYVSALVRLVWKMEIQRPPMKFVHSTEWKGDDLHERYWQGIYSPDASICQVYPILYHGDKVMGKGKVYGLLKKTQ